MVYRGYEIALLLFSKDSRSSGLFDECGDVDFAFRSDGVVHGADERLRSELRALYLFGGLSALNFSSISHLSGEDALGVLRKSGVCALASVSFYLGERLPRVCSSGEGSRPLLDEVSSGLADGWFRIVS